VIFDLGGVIVRTVDPAPRQALASRWGLDAAQLEELVYAGESGQLTQRGQRSLDEHWAIVAARLGLEPAAIPAFLQEFWGGDRIDTALVDYLRLLRPRLRTGLLSNNFPDLRALVCETWRFGDAFDELVISAEVGLLKPAPRIYRLAAQRLGVEPAAAVFVDDSLRNIAGAQAVGMPAVHFRSPKQAMAEVEALINEK
jgi:epoxide hydrolase-like predicted phosphatase